MILESILKVRSRIKVTMECEQLRGHRRAYLAHTGTVRNLSTSFIQLCSPLVRSIQKTGDMAHFLCYNEMEGGDQALNA